MLQASNCGAAPAFKTELSVHLIVCCDNFLWTTESRIRESLMHFLSACKDQQHISESALHTWLGQEGHAQESRALLCQHSSVLHSTWNHLFHSISILYYNPSLIPGVELGHKGQKTSAEEVVHPQRAAVPVKHPLHSRDPEHHQPSSLLLLTKAKQGISPQTAAFCQSHKQLCGSLCALA